MKKYLLLSFLAATSFSLQGEAAVYSYDFGTPSSLLREGFTRVTPGKGKGYTWKSQGKLKAADNKITDSRENKRRNSIEPPPVYFNDLSCDHVTGTADTVLTLKVPAGRYMAWALCGPAGDQCPVDLVRWVEPESDLHDPNCKRNNPPKRKADPSMFDLAGMRKTGKRIAREIIDVYEEGLDEAVSDVPFEHHVQFMQLPLRRVTLADIAAARKAIRDFFNDHPGGCCVDVFVDFEFRSKMLQKIMGLLFNEAVRRMVQAFETRAAQLYGPGRATQPA